MPKATPKTQAGECAQVIRMAGDAVLEKALTQAAEARAASKAQRMMADAPAANTLFAKGLEGAAAEQLLFEHMATTLGYRPNAEAFSLLARRYPLATLKPLLTLPYAQARHQVLARWMGAFGQLNTPLPPQSPPELVQEYNEWRHIWQELETSDPNTTAEAPLHLHTRGVRPWNSPQRRLVGLFHHLYSAGAGGWLKRWLKWLYQLDELKDAPQLKKKAVEWMEETFPTPQWEPWRVLVGFHLPPLPNPAALVGKDRLLVMLANAVLPFFLAWARQNKDKALEQLLYRLFLVLPGEAPNARTKHMLAALGQPKLSASLRSQQGLLQIEQDFCRPYHPHCPECPWPHMLEQLAASSSPPASSNPTI